MTKEHAETIVNKLERAIVEANHKLANAANKAFVQRLKQELVEMLIGT